MTKQECKDLMLEMWKWLAETGLDKDSFFEAHLYYPQYTEDYCVACEYDLQFDDNCDNCPIDWWGMRFCLPLLNKYFKTGIDVRFLRSLTPYQEWLKRPFGSRTKKMYAKEIYKLALRIEV